MKSKYYERVEKLFQRCLMKVLSIDLWKTYLLYIKETKGSLPSYRLVEKCLTVCHKLELTCLFKSCFPIYSFQNPRLLYPPEVFWWILWFSVRYAAAACREIFGANTLRGKLHQLASPNLQDIFIGG